MKHELEFGNPRKNGIYGNRNYLRKRKKKRKMAVLFEMLLLSSHNANFKCHKRFNYENKDCV